MSVEQFQVCGYLGDNENMHYEVLFDGVEQYYQHINSNHIDWLNFKSDLTISENNHKIRIEYENMTHADT